MTGKIFIRLLGASAALGLVLAAIIFVPPYQVASLKQDVATLRSQNPPPAAQDIIAAEKARLDAETAARVAVVQGIGLILVTGSFAWLNYRSNQRKQAEEHYYKALDLLRDDSRYIRIDGINALEQHIKTEKQDTQKVINILATYIRDRSLWIQPTEESQKHEVPLVSTPIDIQEAMKIIVLNNRSYKGSESHRVDLTRVDLRLLVLPPKANLQRINFEQSNLQSAVLPAADLRGAILRNTNLRLATLDNTDFRGAMFQFAKFEHASAESANFEDTNVSASFWHNAKLKGANFKNATCVQTKFVEADLEDAEFHGATLTWTWFEKAKNITEDKIRSQAKSYE